MESYTLLDLILLWKRLQIQRNNYKVIDDVLDIIDNDDIPEENKKGMILSILREENGLYEIAHNIGSEEQELSDNSEGSSHGFEGIPVVIQLFRCNLMNCQIQFESVLN